MKLLVVDDDDSVRDSLRRALVADLYEVETAANGREALAATGRTQYGAIVLDVMMPEIDGIEVCRQLRALGDRTPVLMLTARDAVNDRVDGLDAGADDYLVKPFALEELRARLRALLRRSDTPTETLVYGDLTLDPSTRIVRRGDREIELTLTEFTLLELLLTNAEQVLTRSVIFDRVWGYDLADSSNSLDVYIGYLRRKTEEQGEPRLIHTVRGVGYVLRSPGGE